MDCLWSPTSLIIQMKTLDLRCLYQGLSLVSQIFDNIIQMKTLDLRCLYHGLSLVSQIFDNIIQMKTLDLQMFVSWTVSGLSDL